MSFSFGKKDSEVVQVTDLKKLTRVALQHTHAIEPLPFPKFSGLVFLIVLMVGLVGTIRGVSYPELVWLLLGFGLISSVVNIGDYVLNSEPLWGCDGNVTKNGYIISNPDEEENYRTPKFLKNDEIEKVN